MNKCYKKSTVQTETLQFAFSPNPNTELCCHRVSEWSGCDMAVSSFTGRLSNVDELDLPSAYKMKREAHAAAHAITHLPLMLSIDTHRGEWRRHGYVSDTWVHV